MKPSNLLSKGYDPLINLEVCSPPATGSMPSRSTNPGLLMSGVQLDQRTSPPLVGGRQTFPAHGLIPLWPLTSSSSAFCQPPPPSVCLCCVLQLLHQRNRPGCSRLLPHRGSHLPTVLTIPPLDGVGFLLDLLGVDIAPRHKLAPRLQQPADPFSVGIHGAHEILQFFYGGIRSLERPRHLRVGQNVVLCGRTGMQLTSQKYSSTFWKGPTMRTWRPAGEGRVGGLA